MGTMKKAFAAAVRGADLVHAFLAHLDERETDMDPAHAERLCAIEEMTRLLADATSASPRSLRADLLADTRLLVTRLAADVEDASADESRFLGDDGMRPIEERAGTLCAALLGLSMAIDAIESAIRRSGSRAPAELTAPITLRRPDVRAWASKVVTAVSGLESHILSDPTCGAPGLRRDAWGTALSLTSALAHATEYGFVDARVVMRRLSEAASLITQAVALISSDAAARGVAMEMRHVETCLSVMPAIEEGMRLVKAALSDPAADAPAMTWHMMVKGRVRLSDEQVETIARRLSDGGGNVVLLDALRRGARAVRLDWAPEGLGIAS